MPQETYRLSVEDSTQNAVIVRIMVSESADETTPSAMNSGSDKTEDTKVKVAKKSIRDALNSSETVKRSAWKDVGDMEWESGRYITQRGLTI